jgi:hypothetical protein
MLLPPLDLICNIKDKFGNDMFPAYLFMDVKVVYKWQLILLAFRDNCEAYNYYFS